MISIVPRIYLGSFEEAKAEAKKKTNRLRGVETSLDIEKSARNLLWWAWGHNENVLVWSWNDESARETIEYFLVECMAFTAKGAHEFVEAKCKQ